MASIAPGLSAALQDRYRLDRELGQGGMATVYLAHDLRNNRKVALKVLRPELAAVIGAERFLKEIETTANLQHPHILPLFDSGVVGPGSGGAGGQAFLYYAMPFVEGESLRDRLAREQQLPVDDAVRIATEVAGALDYAHRHGVIHRDIKPENILLHDGTALVADFGIALAVTEAGGSRLTETGLSLGTPQYMSPEQGAGDRLLDGRSDQYSLACVLYEMLAGEPPFTGPTLQAITARKLNDSMPSLRTVRELVPAGVEAATRRALSKAPADRYPTTQRFAEALSVSGPQLVTAPGTESPAYRAPWRIALAFGTVAIAAALAGMLLTWRHFAAVTPDPPVVRFAIQPLQGDSISFREPRSLDISSDGRRIVFLGAHGGDTVVRLYLRDLRGGGTVALHGTEGAHAPFFKPDGEWIGYFERGTDRLMKVPAQGGQPQVVCDCGPSTGADWGSDGWIVFDPGTERELTSLRRVRETGGAAELLPLADTTYSSTIWGLFGPRLLPDGKTVLVTANGAAASRVSAVSLETGRRTDLVLGAWRGQYLDPGYLVYAKARELWAVRFDPRRLAVTGEPVLVVDSMQSAPDAWAEYALSRSGTLAYGRPLQVTGRDGHRLVWVDRNGRIDPIADVPGGYWMGPRLSPDGSRIAYWGFPYDAGAGDHGRVWLYASTHGAPRALTDAAYTSAWPIFSADGKSVISNSNRGSRALFAELYRTPIDGGSAPERLTTPVGDTASAPILMQQPGSWSPDGRTLAFQEGYHRKTLYDLYALSLGGDSGTRPLLTTEANERLPTFSPDGRWLAYVTDESGRFQIYARRWPAFDEPVQITRDGGDEPAWSRDGRELLFVKGQGVWGVPFDDGRTGAARLVVNGTQQGRRNALRLFGIFGRMYDIAPDGRFLMVQREDNVPSGTEYEVVLNWTAELRRRFEGKR
jgi:eukaryotic-like serine/threonine-protein kinase